MWPSSGCRCPARSATTTWWSRRSRGWSRSPTPTRWPPATPSTSADLLDEPFLALPASAGPLRDYWLATDARAGRPPLIGAEIAGTEETYEALVAHLGVVLLAAGNAPLLTLGGVTTRPVHGITPAASPSPGAPPTHAP